MRDATLLSSMYRSINSDFNPRVPCGTRRRKKMNENEVIYISIHASHAGRDNSSLGWLFIYRISIHASYAGRDDILNFAKSNKYISIHASHAGRDLNVLFCCLPVCYFNPRVPCGTRQAPTTELNVEMLISIHASHAGRDKLSLTVILTRQISIHASHAGRD